jgi:hypothetical protein
MDLFPGKLREYCVRGTDGQPYGAITVWATNCASATAQLRAMGAFYNSMPGALHASSVRRIEDETAETLRDE